MNRRGLILILRPLVSFLAGASVQANAAPALYFEANIGQADESVSFVARAQGYVAYLTADGARFRTRGSSLKMQIVGAEPLARQVGVEVLDGHINYLVGNEPNQWVTNVPIYGRVAIADIRP